MKRKLLVMTLAGFASGCASVGPLDLGPVQRAVGERVPALQDTPASRHTSAEARQAWLDEQLGKTLTADDVARIALVNSPALRAELVELGIAQADAIQAGLISNPRLAVAALRPEGGGRWELDFGLSQSLLDVMTRPLRQKLAQAEFERTQLEVAERLTQALLEIRAAYLDALGLQHRAAILDVLATAAETGAELARRYRAAGNITELSLLLESTEATRRRFEAMAAQAEARKSRSRLAAMLGLPDASRLKLPAQLPDLPDLALARADLFRRALALRLDRQIVQQSKVQQEQALALTRRTGGFTELDLGLAATREPEGEARIGPELSVSVPVFDQGQARIAGLEARLLQTEARLQALDLAIGNGLDEAITEIEARRAVVEGLRATIIPQRERIVELTQRNVNFMLAGAFDLVLAKQQEYAAYVDYVDALNGYWQALARLNVVLGGGLIVPATAPAPLPGLRESTPMDHSQHKVMDHSLHQGMNGSEDKAMDHSQHQGMDHSQHVMPSPPADAPEADKKPEQSGHEPHPHEDEQP